MDSNRSSNSARQAMAVNQDNNRIELLDAENFSEYVLRDPLEVATVLNGLIQQRCIVSAHPDGKRNFMLTTLLSADRSGSSLVFDAPSDEMSLQRALESKAITFSALLEKIKVQFTCSPVTAGTHEGHPALVVPWPVQLLRLQRREYFRLITPVAHSVTCNIPIAQDASVKTFEARVLDISGGGIGVLVPPRGLQLSTDMLFEDCSLLLPEFGDISTRLRIRSIFQVTNRNGMTMMRAGCQFVDLPRGAENTIQKYILKIERERNARSRRL